MPVYSLNAARIAPTLNAVNVAALGAVSRRPAASFGVSIGPKARFALDGARDETRAPLLRPRLAF